MKTKNAKTNNMKNIKTQQIEPPLQMSDANVTVETLAKMALSATELTLIIKNLMHEIKEREQRLEEIRKEYNAAKPKVLGLLSVLEAQK